MRKINNLIPLALIALHFMGFVSATDDEDRKSDHLSIGWAVADITPDEQVVISGGSSARLSQGVKDPITATVLTLESFRDGAPVDKVVMVSVDLVAVSDLLQDRIYDMVQQKLPDIEVANIILNATHTHTAPDVATSPGLAEMHRTHGIDVPLEWSRWGYNLEVMSAKDYVEFAAERITNAISQAWSGREPGGISFGLAHAAVGQNRLTAYYDGSSEMYGSTDDPEFSHMEGFEDHSLSLLYTWDANEELTGVLVNVAIPSQVEYGSELSADFWHETRVELRQRLGEDLFVFPQTAASGDQSPRIMIDHRAEARMQELTGRNQREQIAVRISDAVTSILPYMEQSIDWNPVLVHRREYVDLDRRRISVEDITTRRRTFHTPVVESVEEAYPRLLGEYKEMFHELEENPGLKEEENWFSPITGLHWRLSRAWSTLERYELQDREPTIPVEVHVVRIGDMSIATSPFELYIDFGMQMKARSKSVQTFVVELAGPSRGYVPTHRSVAGGAYGAIPQSTQIGPEGGRNLINQTLDLIDSLWDDQYSGRTESQN